MELLLKHFKDLKITNDTLIHKEEHSFIDFKEGKRRDIKGVIKYTIIDQSNQREPIELEIKE